MRQYYPVISVAAAILLLLLPVVILLGSSDKNGPPESKEDSASISQEEYEQLKQQLSLANSKLRALENNASETTKSAKPSDTQKSAGQAMGPAWQAADSVVQPQPHAAGADNLQRLEDQIDALNEQLAQLVAAKSAPADSPVSKTEEAIVEGENSDSPDLASSTVAQPETVASAGEEVPLAHPETPTIQPTPEPEPKPVKMLTASELSKEARMNLRDRMATDADPAEFDEEPVEQIVEIFLRRPLDGMTVNRVEQLYAQTTAPGWPVVLVRSSFDDEQWWAQPISGRRGTQITARMHFGNDETPRGTAFSMVILLLDGYEEAVRFRTARRFDKIPKGVRRSRQFMFVLK